MSFTWSSVINITVLTLLLAAAVAACFTLPIDKILKELLQWIDCNFGPWGPVALIIAYIPLTIFVIPAAVLSLGGGYLFGLPIGFIADSIGATVGSVAAFLLGRTIGKSLVVSRLKDYPQFRLVTIAIQRSGFKISLLLRLAPFVPFNMLNYLLSVTPISLGEYTLTSWLGMMPITLALVYVGTTLKDISDVTRWGEFSKTHLPWLISGLVISVILMVWVTIVAKSTLDKALAECEDMNGTASSPELSIIFENSVDLNQPLLNKTGRDEDSHE